MVPQNPYLANPYLPLYNQGQLVQPMYQQPQQSVNGITKVRGPESAIQYSMGPNSISPALFDENGKVFYVVSTDGTGTKSLETFDYMPHVGQQPQASQPEYVTREEFQQLLTKVSQLEVASNGTDGSVQAAQQA